MPAFRRSLLSAFTRQLCAVVLTLSLFPVVSFAQASSTKPLALAGTPQVVKVENAGLLFTDNSAGVTGTDAGYSIPLAQESLWLFGDVFLQDPSSPSAASRGAVSNCALLAKAGTGVAPLHSYTFLTDPASGVARQVLPLLPGESKDLRFWPFGGWYSPAEKRVYLYYGQVRVTGGGPFDFRIEGHGLASADATVPSKIQFTRLPAQTKEPLWWNDGKESTLFGSAVIANASGDTLYIVGVQERGGRKYSKLARVPKAQIADSAAYTYFAGTPSSPRWSRQPSEAADVEGLTDFPNELSVAYNAYLGGYLAFHSIGVSDRARLCLAPTPWGPYRQIGEIATPHRAFAKAFCYAGKEHPELAEEHGRILYITYVDSDRYWLHLLKITLHR